MVCKQEWTAALVPCAVAELCAASCSQAAAALVVAHTGLHAAFCSTDNGIALLEPYLEGHAAALRQQASKPDLVSPDLGVPASAEVLWRLLPAQIAHGLRQLLQ